ncbi:MAG: hypothetical protein WAK61_12625 [Leclercia sp.]
MRIKILFFSSLFVFTNAFGNGVLGTADKISDAYKIYGEGKALTYDVQTISRIINDVKSNYGGRTGEMFNNLDSHITNLSNIPRNYSLSTAPYNAAINGMLIIKVHDVTKDECKKLYDIYMASYNEQKDERLKPLVNDGLDNNSCKAINTFTVKVYD